MTDLASPPRFQPHPAAPGGDLQTILGAALPAGAPMLELQAGFERVAVPLRCGGQLEGWYRSGAHLPAVLLLHGLGGSVRSGYIRRAAARAAAEGHAVLALAHRGSGERMERTSRPYMAGNVADVDDALTWLRERTRSPRVLAVGYSISGNTLLKLLGSGVAEPPELSLTVCPPIDLDRASDELRRARAKPYDLWVLRSCRRWIPRLRGDAPGSFRVPRLSGLRCFDERYITPVWDFESLDDYYSSASAVSYLPSIVSPTVILHASDDPIVSSRTVESAATSRHVKVEIIRGGGHLGFLGRSENSARMRRWLPDALAHYLAVCRGASAAPPPSHPLPAEPFECARP